MPLDLALFLALVEERRERWETAGVGVEIHPSLPWAARVRCETPSALAEVTIWETGEADLIVGSIGDGSTETEHYEVTGELGLVGLLDDLETAITTSR